MRMQLACLSLVIAMHVPWVLAAEGPPCRPATKNPAPGDVQPTSAAKLRVAAVQMRSTRDLAANILTTKKQLERCARDGARVAVFPECSLSGYFEAEYMKAISAAQLADAEKRIANACREQDIYAVVGMPWREDGKLFNSAVVIDPQGKVIERYHKTHLAESWPDGGDHLAVFKIDGVPCSIIICHDERYPELVRLPVLAGARCIFYISHESDLKRESKIAPYRAQIQARAVENTVYVVQANAPANSDASGSHGHSRIIAPDGNIVEEATVFGEDVLVKTLDMTLATGNTARASADRGPLADWWRAGIKRVRILDSPTDGDNGR
jgi:predicted amidohydrolase